MWQKTLFYLGLVDDDQDESTEDTATAADQAVRPISTEPAPASPRPIQARPPGTVAGRRVEPPASSRRRVSATPEYREAGVYIHQAQDIPAYPGADADSEIIVARRFSDAQALADGIRVGRAVVLDLRSTEPEMVRRLVDFTSGLTYALDGKMAKIAQGVILVTPAGVSVSLAEQDRLAALGLLTRNDA